ncbi:MAG: ATP-binding protein [Rubrivivax sp.]|nr:ATP-binding protein [Rubrivivax sp.]
MHGLSGSGKSEVALDLVGALGAIRIRSDVERKRLHGLTPRERVPDAARGALYGPEATRRTFDHLARTARTLLDAGLHVVVDAAFLRRSERDRFRALAADAGAQARLVECVAPEAVLRARLAARADAGDDASDADGQVLDLQLRIGEPPAADEAAWRLDTDAPRDVVAARAAALADAWRRGA